MVLELFVLILVIVPVALVDVFDFYSTIFKIYQTKHPIYNFFYFIIPYFFSYYLMGIIFLLLEDQVEFFLYHISSSWNFAVAWFFIVIGIVSIFFSIYKFKQEEGNRKELENENSIKILEKYKKIEGLKYGLIGFFWIMSYMSFAFPYFVIVFRIGVIYNEFFILVLILFVYSLLLIALSIILFILYLKKREKFQQHLQSFFSFLRNPKYQGYKWLISGCILLIVGFFWMP